MLPELLQLREMVLLEESLKLNIRGLCLSGAWRPEWCNKAIYYIYSFIISGLLVFSISLGPAIMLVVEKETDLKEITGRAFLFSETILIPLKVLILLCWEKEVKEIAGYFDRNIAKRSTKAEEMVNQMIRRTNLYSKVYVYGSQVIVFLLCSKPIFYFTEKPLVFEMWLPYDHKSSNAIYIFTSAYMTLGKKFYDF